MYVPVAEVLRQTVYFVAPLTEFQLILMLVGPVAVTEGADGADGVDDGGVVADV